MKLLRAVVCVSIIAVFAFAPSLASADQHRFLGTHPIHHGHGGKFCYIEFPHVHVYPPAQSTVLYRKKAGWHHFVGDPVAHGYDGRKHSFYGAHPIHQNEVVLGVRAGSEPVVHWCYLKGPHFHMFAPSASAKFEVKGKANWFVGVYPPSFDKHKHRHVRINRFYARRKYRRPIIEVTPPSAYLDILIVGRKGKRGHAHGHFKGGVKAGVEVRVPVPSVEIHLGGGKVKHRKHHPGKHKSWGRGKYKAKRKGKYKAKRQGRHRP